MASDKMSEVIIEIQAPCVIPPHTCNTHSHTNIHTHPKHLATLQEYRVRREAGAVCMWVQTYHVHEDVANTCVLLIPGLHPGAQLDQETLCQTQKWL